ncbi:MAG TPA: hypothetical protein VGG89_10080 [Candidatus Baltobacteraceae bacterium]
MVKDPAVQGDRDGIRVGQILVEQQQKLQGLTVGFLLTGHDSARLIDGGSHIGRGLGASGLSVEKNGEQRYGQPTRDAERFVSPAVHF